MSQIVYYAALSVNDFIGPKKYDKIIKQFGSIDEYFGLSVSEMMRAVNVKETEKSLPVFENMLREGEKITEICEYNDIKMITIEDDRYHPKLKTIPEPPFMYYQRGEYNYSIKTVAVVGTRKLTREAEEINRYFTKELVEYNIGIISGMALGHDSIAQMVALENDGYTVAVLGSGIDFVYPKENRNLYRQIVEKGAVISEYPPGVSPERWRFPLRNRIISGLSDAVFLVQAPGRSGSLITGKYAEAQGKDIFVIPGNPMDESYAGSNELLQRGAVVALKPEDIVLHLTGKLPKKKENHDHVIVQLNNDEKTVWENLTEEVYIDDLSGLTGIGVIKLNSILTRMELMGLITQYPGRFFVRN